VSGTFRLGVVLRLREMAEDAARARLATAVTGHREATERLIELTVAEEASMARLVEMGEAGAQAGELRAARAGVETAEGATLAGRRKLEAASEVLMQARSSLAEASKRREVNLLSEIAGVRHARAISSHEVEP
jgi:flagellar export protein FliJ